MFTCTYIWMTYKQLSPCHFLPSEISSVAPQCPWPRRVKLFTIQPQSALRNLSHQCLQTSRMLVGVVVSSLSVSCLPRALGIPWQWNSMSPLEHPLRRVPGIQGGCWLPTTHISGIWCNFAHFAFVLFLPLSSFRLEMDYCFAFESGGKSIHLSSPL